MNGDTGEKFKEPMSEEDKLRAANQQLKAANQQLGATEQQLRAANQQLRSTEQELRQSRQQYKTIFEGSINAIAVYDVVDDGNDFVLRNFNPSAERTEKTKRENVLGKSVLQVLPTVARFGLFDIFQTVFRTGKPQHHLETMHEDGRIWGWRENYVFKLPTGQIVVIYEDITERKRAEEARAEEHNLLRTLIDNLPDSIYVKDTKSRFVIANIEVARRVGLETPDEMIGKTDMDFHPQELASKYYADSQHIIRSGRPLINREEQVIDQQTGQARWNLTTKVPWRDSGGKIVGIVGIGRDITKRKQAEEALGAANQQLNASNQQFNAANQQLKATEQQLKAANQQLRANEGELKQLNQDLGERVKELNCLYGLSHLAERRDITLEEIFQGLAELIPPGWQYPEITAARITFEDLRFKTNNFRKTACLQSADVKVHGQKAGSIEVCYLKKRPVIDEGPFLKEERNLLNALAERLGYIVERKQAEEALGTANQQLNASNQQFNAANQQLKAANQQLKATEQQLKAANRQLAAEEQQLRAANKQLAAEEQQLRAANQQLKATEQELLDYQAQLKSLASQLSLAEERERRRVAAELHDRIGQSLAVSKLQLDTLWASAPSGDLAKTLKEVCNSIDQTIQNTRSLTFDLSSPILYELGFEAAVAEWLTEQVGQKHDIATEFEDDELPKPLDESVCVLLFRDVRELLVNVIKHARARKVKVSIRKRDDTICVSVEDDGVGFDPDRIAPTPTQTGGFGLFSIRERLEQLGGRLKIESQPGKGSKITMTAPLESENDTGERQL
jgi:PAS domain S-box-containing protein